MRNCDIRKLQLYLDGELPEKSARQVAAHLGGCPVCRRELAGLRRLSELLGDFPELPPSPAIRLTTKARTEDFCAQAGPAIGPFLEGILPKSPRERLALHFALCQNCREELAAQKQLRALTAALPEQVPPEKIRLTVQEALRQRRRARLAAVSPWLRIRRVTTAAALAALAVALVWVFPNLSANNPSPETAAVSPDQNGNTPPPARLAEQPPMETALAENRVAEVTPAEPAVSVAATPQPSEESIAFVPIRSRNLTYRHVSSPGRIVEISSPSEASVEMAAFSETEGGSYHAAPAPAAADPTTVAAARQDLLRASEQYEVLQMERALSHLPGPERLITTPINDNKKPMKEPDASKFGSSRFV